MSDLQARIEVLRPKVGDTIVLSFYGRLSKQQYDHIIGHFGPKVPAGVKMMVLDSSVSLSHIVNPEPASEPHPADVMGYGAWHRDQIERAHREFMERTSRRLRCDWTTEDIERYIGGAMG